MSPEFRRRVLVPLAILFLAIYLVGFRVYQHRAVIMLPPVTTLPPE